MAVAKKTAAVEKKAPAMTKAPAETSAKPDLKKFLGEIEKRAYEIYQERTGKGQTGNDMSDWIKAEAEIKKKYKI